MPILVISYTFATSGNFTFSQSLAAGAEGEDPGATNNCYAVVHDGQIIDYRLAD